MGWTIIASPFCAKQGAKPYNTLILSLPGIMPPGSPAIARRIAVASYQCLVLSAYSSHLVFKEPTGYKVLPARLQTGIDELGQHYHSGISNDATVRG